MLSQGARDGAGSRTGVRQGPFKGDYATIVMMRWRDRVHVGDKSRKIEVRNNHYEKMRLSRSQNKGQ